jgi:hypothetical protein
MNAVVLEDTDYQTVNASPRRVCRLQSDNCHPKIPVTDAVLPPEQMPSTAIDILLNATVEQEVLVLL